MSPLPALRRPPARRRIAGAAHTLLVLVPALAVAGCTVRIAGVDVPIPAPGRTTDRPGPRRPGASVPPNRTAARVLASADRYVGVPYRWGGTSPRTGFDCSGYVQYVYDREGVRLPRTSRQQAHAGARRPTRWDAAGPGDLVLFAEPGEPISHVAFYVGRGRILHASASGGGVRYDDLDSRRGAWYRQRLVGVRRVSERGPSVARGLLQSLGLADTPLDPPDRAPAPR